MMPLIFKGKFHRRKGPSDSWKLEGTEIHVNPWHVTAWRDVGDGTAEVAIAGLSGWILLDEKFEDVNKAIREADRAGIAMPKQKIEAMRYEIPGFPYAAMIIGDKIVAFLDKDDEEISPDEIARKRRPEGGGTMWEYWMGDARQWKTRVQPLPPNEARVFSADTVDGVRNVVKGLRAHGVPEPMLTPILEWVNDKEKLIHQ